MLKLQMIVLVFLLSAPFPKIKNYTACVQIPKHQDNGLSQDSELITFQIRSIAHTKLQKKLETITQEQLEKNFWDYMMFCITRHNKKYIRF